MTIPARLHFCWIGRRLPWAYVFAILSAAEHAQMPELVLHHTDALEDGAELSALSSAAGLVLDRFDPVGYLLETGRALGIGEHLATLYQRLARPAMQADILRAAFLFRQGGLYLDLDTITIASLLPLLDAPHFLGAEYIVWPQFVRASRSPALWTRSLALDLLRKAMRRMTSGWTYFRRVERLYYRAVNNAVMGAEPGSSLLARYLRAMPDVPIEKLHDAYALGPDLLQSIIAHDPPDDLVIHDPHVFYPLPPEISEHWFRARPSVRLDAALLPETRIVHWYASVRTKPLVALISPGYVRSHREHQLYSALVLSSLSRLPDEM